MAELAALAAIIGETAAAAGTAVASAASTVAPVASVVGTGLTAAGTIAAGRSAAAQGKFAQQAADYEAAQLDIRAKEEKAAAQRDAREFQRRKEHALSANQARAGAGGFSATDPTALAIADELARYGTLQEQTAQYGGNSRMAGTYAQANARRMEGDMARFEGNAKKNASYLNAAGTIMGGITDLASKYNPKGAGGWKTTTYRYG
jgi:hypothetical protein